MHDGTPLQGVLTYDESEYGFSFSTQSRESLNQRLGSQGVTSVLIDTLQLEVDIESREVLFAWGYFPITRSVVAEFSDPHYIPGRVSISSDNTFEPGVSFEIPGDSWHISHDPASGWIVVRQTEAAGIEFVQIATGTVLGIANGNLVSVWLHPTFTGRQEMK